MWKLTAIPRKGLRPLSSSGLVKTAFCRETRIRFLILWKTERNILSTHPENGKAYSKSVLLHRQMNYVWIWHFSHVSYPVRYQLQRNHQPFVQVLHTTDRRLSQAFISRAGLWALNTEDNIKSWQLHTQLLWWKSFKSKQSPQYFQLTYLSNFQLILMASLNSISTALCPNAKFKAWVCHWFPKKALQCWAWSCP